MNYLDLFSGIGGFALGARMAGLKFDHHFNSDIEDYPNQVYAKNFPGAIHLGDITKIEPEKLPAGEWVATAGFPCQDISIAGYGAGISGDRSGLWFEARRIFRTLRPRLIIAENVGAITFRGLDAVLASLAEIGYDAEWQNIRASDMGAPHRRERIWIVAYPNASGERRESWQNEKDVMADSDGERFSECDTTAIAIKTRQFAGRNYADAWRDGETDESGRIIKPGICLLANGIPRGVDRLKGLGNAIVPQIAAMLFELVIESGHIK